MRDYVVMDLENPNFRQNSICAIGVMLIRNNNVVERKYSLINPEDTFDNINIQITKIAPHMIKQSPTLPEYWSEISSWLSNNVIVGHNITYDLRVLTKSLQRYDLEVPEFNYCCTLTQSRKNLDLPSYKLENIAKKLHIIYNPHNAIEDARAAYELFEYINRHNPIGTNQVKQYKYKPKTESYDPKLSTNINNLYGMVQVLIYNQSSTQKQLNLLNSWLQENMKYNHYPLFDDITKKITSIVDKGCVNGEDKEKLSTIESVNQSNIYKPNTLKTQVLQGIIKIITADNKITHEELKYLDSWLDQNKSLKGTYPYDKIVEITTSLLKKNTVGENEYINVSKMFLELLSPIKTTVESLDLEGKTYCLTGDFKHGNKAKIVSILEKRGLIKKNCVSYKLDYLFVGDYGSPAWKYGNIGGKIVKAQQIIDKGAKIKTISEKNLFNELGIE